MVGKGGVEPPMFPSGGFTVRCPATDRSIFPLCNGTDSWDRTSDLLLRRQLFCPLNYVGYVK